MLDESLYPPQQKVNTEKPATNNRVHGRHKGMLPVQDRIDLSGAGGKKMEGHGIPVAGILAGRWSWKPAKFSVWFCEQLAGFLCRKPREAIKKGEMKDRR